MKRVPHVELERRPDGVHYHDGEAFTGISLFVGKSGSVKAEHEFQDGVRSGTCRTFYPSGELASEEAYERDVAHGLRHEWHENGRLASEEMFEFGIRVWSRRWDDGGRQVVDYRLPNDDPRHRVLLLLRATNGFSGPLGVPSESSWPSFEIRDEIP